MCEHDRVYPTAQIVYKLSLRSSAGWQDEPSPGGQKHFYFEHFHFEHFHFEHFYFCFYHFHWIEQYHFEYLNFHFQHFYFTSKTFILNASTNFLINGLSHPILGYLKPPNASFSPLFIAGINGIAF